MVPRAAEIKMLTPNSGHSFTKMAVILLTWFKFSVYENFPFINL